MKRGAFLIGLLGLAVVGGLTWWLIQAWRTPAAPPGPPDPRLTYATPFLNVRPEVNYVGDAACAPCHQGIAETYRDHPMGRSFFRVAEVANAERYDEAVHNPFTKADTEYVVRRDGGRVVHRASRKGADGRPLFECEAEAAYAIGSGTRGRSYLIDRDGRLFQSPISWYSQRQTWDLSPGYAKDRLFDRPVIADCLFCHANDADPVPDTVNGYRAPIFHQHAIGCERCHGPGELHVAARTRGDVLSGIDPTIVNPKHLDPVLRESVCQQCHLQGQVRVVKRGREPFDFRPGLPLHLFLSVYVRVPKLAERSKAVGHVEQMYASRCFQASGGKMGCATCHDPHARPSEAKRVAFYRDRCLTCHGEQSCSLEPAVRRKTHADDNCAACHMPRQLSSDIVHTAVTDHRVRRKPVDPSGGVPPPLAPGELPVMHFHQDLVAPHDPEASRDLGLALVQLMREMPQVSRFLAPEAEERLMAADPHDVPARAALAFALGAQGRTGAALTSYEDLLRLWPGREVVLDDAALLATQAGRTEDALRYAQRLVEVNPWNPSHHQRLAQARAAAGQWAEAAAACRATLRLSPARLEIRQLLVRCLIVLGERAQAETEFETLVALEPDREGDLRRWFAEQTR